ncbi:hypothetical protein [Nitrospirillum sp. BR 11828]|uniref:hypothetical protein n=1 Tax=Nitrospirillum sp. BR 11828 TaxID=3104325 RepID=UPI002ACAC986|nr:hypothetical protein [Nitrospirillum sp. BR 11828]MDZ5646264.1 hypothetical protein [Nitrospirillum sp. BR 11828]
MALAVPAWAQGAKTPSAPADPSCKGVAVEWPADLKAWGITAVPVTAATASAAAPTLTPGVPARVTLAPKAGVTLAAAPPASQSKPVAESTYAGILSFTVPAAGPYRIALDAGAWIDVVAEGKALDSTSHKHGPNCSGIHKVVDFGLAAGTYQLQLSNSLVPAVTVLVVPPQG